MKRWTLAIGLSGILLTGCVVPFKKPPIQTGPTVEPKIDFKELAEYALASSNAYETLETIEKAYGKDNIVVRDLPNSEGRYIIYFDHKNKTQTLAVRGTANKANALVDIDSIKIFDPHLKIFIHRGFLKASNDLYADALPFLQKDYKTRLTGHSLGGAMACILMMKMIHDGYPIEQVITFGQPKVTNEQGGRDFATAPYFRIIDDGDIVAQVPPSNLVYDLSGTYEHFGPEIKIFLDKKYTYSPYHIPLDYITNNNWKALAISNATDHFIKTYIDRIALQK